MLIRKAHQEDQAAILSLFQQASVYFQQAKIDQWQDGYPNIENILEDLKNENLYVLEDNHLIIGCETVSFAADENYRQMIEGCWITEGPYAVIHRIVVNNERKGQGIAKILLDEAIELCKRQKVWSIKIDTHQNNQSMRRFLDKQGFHYCGIIQLHRDKAFRVAYEKVLQE